MPIRSSFGALKLQLPSLNRLQTSYWLNLSTTDYVGFYDNAIYHLMSNNNIYVQLNDRNETLSALSYTGTVPQGGFTKITTNNAGDAIFVIDYTRNYGFTQITGPQQRFTSNTGSMILGNVFFDTNNSPIICGEAVAIGDFANQFGISSYGHVQGNAGNFTFLTSTPTFIGSRTIITDATSDGTSTYITGRTGQGLLNAFTIKLNSTGNIVWVQSGGGGLISLIDNGDNIIVTSGYDPAGTASPSIVYKRSTINGQLSNISYLGNALFPTGTLSTNRVIIQSLNVTDNKILIGGQYLRSVSPNRFDGFFMSLNSDLTLIYKNQINSTMPPSATPPALSVRSVQQDLIQNAHYISMQNFASPNIFGMTLKTPSDGTILGNGIYTNGPYITTLSDGDNITYSSTGTGGPGFSNIIEVAASISSGGISRTFAASASIPIIKTFINT